MAVWRWQYYDEVLLPLVFVGADHRLRPWMVALVMWRHHAMCCYQCCLVVRGGHKLYCYCWYMSMVEIAYSHRSGCVGVKALLLLVHAAWEKQAKAMAITIQGRGHAM